METFNLSKDQFETDYEKVCQRIVVRRVEDVGTAPIIFKRKGEDDLYIGTVEFKFDIDGIGRTDVISWRYTNCRKLRDDENPDEITRDW